MRAFASIVACAAALLAQPMQAVENPPSWNVYTTANSDLPNNRVFEIAPDKLGRVWLSCNGLTMFNGTDWKNFPTVTVIQVAVAADNTVWCASDLFGGALTHCDGATVTSFNSSNSQLPSDWVTGVTVDNNNTVWVGCNYTGVGKYDGTTWTKYLSSAETGGGHLTMAHGRDNTIWMASGTAVHRFRNGEWKAIDVPGLTPGEDDVSDIVCAADGSIWVGTSSFNGSALGVGHYNGTDWTFYSTDNGELPTSAVQTVALDSSGVLWVGTTEGLTSFDGTAWETRTKSNWVLPDNIVRSIAVASDNSLWVGTNDGLLHATQLTTGVAEPAATLGLVLMPNPAPGGNAAVSFALSAPAHTDVEVYSLAGERLAVVASGALSAGEHRFNIDNTALAAGSYYCVVKTDGRIVANTPFVVVR